MRLQGKRLDLFFVFLGLVVGFVSLVGVAIFPFGDISLSIIKSEATFTVRGFRVHHWLLGIGCMFVGWFFKGKVGSLIFGLGLAFLLDDLTDIGGSAIAK